MSCLSHHECLHHVAERREDVEGLASPASKSESSSSSSSGTAAVESIGTSSVGGSVETSSAVDSTLDLFVVLALASTVFFCALCYLRKIALIGA